jgi:hypothetical protein
LPISLPLSVNSRVVIGEEWNVSCALAVILAAAMNHKATCTNARATVNPMINETHIISDFSSKRNCGLLLPLAWLPTDDIENCHLIVVVVVELRLSDYQCS